MKHAGEHHEPFSRAMWDRWLVKLNEPAHPLLEAGVAEMRELLQCRCLGAEHHAVESEDAYRNFVARTFGGTK